MTFKNIDLLHVQNQYYFIVIVIERICFKKFCCTVSGINALTVSVKQPSFNFKDINAVLCTCNQV